ncbi:hypothetical protein AAV35_012890 [Salimicrobium jeotgali]|uniref:SAP domain-containing protein n=1 Tax=Salimicrobium jeotgali TaxID=1230341 RepID=K2G5D1_9BACI|nr:SAP domain-containing protein [Salimicrobium jeotgali]AKG05557.1 hypothetical protein AAV35_012890 [Salimicrobium jeotgali]EKE30448.1 hypothetical protein MJ3_13444 [Salimicrobium jeotgali]MBM7696591.1 putative transcriptional regulator [Salimicrobium jeotgali]
MGILSWLKKLSGDSENQKNTTDLSSSTKSDGTHFDINPVYRKKLSNDLFPGEVLLLNWINGNSIPESFPNYFAYHYGIDASSSLDRLISGGFLRYATATETITKLKNDELKEILKSHDLKVSGKKADLIDRIQEYLSSNEIEEEVNKYSSKLFLTDKGQEVFEEFYYIVPAHRFGSKDGSYNVANAIKFIKNSKAGVTNYDIALDLLKKEEKSNLKSENFGLYRNNKLYLYDLHKREAMNDYSFMYILQVFIMDMSGLDNAQYIDKPESIMFAPGIRNNIIKEIERNQMNESQVHTKFSEAWNHLIPDLPFHYLTEEECLSALWLFIDEEEEKARQLITNSYKNLNKNEITKKTNLYFLDDLI